ncbi:hypothetical protein [Algoriphagus sp. CAU 1675]|uniref:energy transducer TonB n=1 Tax=Algoriphagus sp. CAU 1675 TaxID=3032597 RepID=UPI0023DBC369|nr:hypothetical protein [Algoriphagus sp. CAU 1675]MDF2159066.1 hypothetical protein [Algoriphagus sp. CAU 1675]
MRILILICFAFLTYNVKAQSEKIYDYSNPSLTIKPAPSEEFEIWLKENNQKLGVKAPYSSKKGTKVTLVFIVDENGRIQNPKIWRGIGQGYDEYAYELIKSNPNYWISGKTDASNVKTEVYYQLDFMKNNNSIRTKENDLMK